MYLCKPGTLHYRDTLDLTFMITNMKHILLTRLPHTFCSVFTNHSRSKSVNIVHRLTLYDLQILITLLELITLIYYKYAIADALYQLLCYIISPIGYVISSIETISQTTALCLQVYCTYVLGHCGTS